MEKGALSMAPSLGGGETPLTGARKVEAMLGIKRGHSQWECQHGAPASKEAKDWVTHCGTSASRQDFVDIGIINIMTYVSGRALASAEQPMNSLQAKQTPTTLPSSLTCTCCLS